MVNKYCIIFIGWLIASFSYGQMPDPQDFCSHAQTHHTEKRSAQIDYNHYDSYDVLFYHLNLNAESNTTFLSGDVLIKAKSLENPIDTLVLELSDVFNVESITINQNSLNFIHQNNVIYVVFNDEIQPHQSFEIHIKYSGSAEAENGRGFNLKENFHGTSITWTLSEPFYSKEWWPCKQDLYDKADSVWVFVTTSKENKVGSNGLLVHTEELENDKIRYEWKSKYPIAYYLISIAVAEYMEYSFETENQNSENVFMQNYLYPDSVMFKNQKALIDCTQMQMNLLQKKYGKYPFIEEKYGHCITPIGGGMEHQTMTTQRDFSFHLTIHEMGHSWFGNQVTCARWNDIWVNEGFATYTQYLGLQYLSSEENADGFMAGMQSIVMEEPDGSVFVPDEFLNDRSRIFSGRLSYYKGAVIIQMIRYLLDDDDLFFDILREYQFRFKNSVATAEDFKTVLEELSGQDFDTFFDLWYYGEGYPIYDFQWEQPISNELKINAKQQSSTPKTPFFHMKYDMLLFFEDGSEQKIQLEQQKQEEKFIIPLNKRVKNILPNPRSQNLMKVLSNKQGILLPNEVKIEPNPVHEKCVLRFGNYQSNRSIEIYNTQQKLLLKQKAEQITKVIDLKPYSSGVYFILVKNKNQYDMHKLIKY